MKKIILTVIAVTTLTIYSCKKTTVTPTGTTPVISADESNDENIAQEKDLTKRIWFDNGDQPGIDGEDYGCRDQGGNCFHDFVVLGIVGPAIDGLINVVTTGADAEIINAFEDNYETLLTFIDAGYIDGVILGDLTVSVRGDDPEQNRYLIFTSVETEEIKAVYPTKLEE